MLKFSKQDRTSLFFVFGSVVGATAYLIGEILL